MENQSLRGNCRVLDSIFSSTEITFEPSGNSFCMHRFLRFFVFFCSVPMSLELTCLYNDAKSPILFRINKRAPALKQRHRMNPSANSQGDFVCCDNIFWARARLLTSHTISPASCAYTSSGGSWSYERRKGRHVWMSTNGS